MLILTRRVARFDHAWQAVPCQTCNAEIGRPCDTEVFNGPRWVHNGAHRQRHQFAELLGFTETQQYTLEIERAEGQQRKR